MYENKYYIKSSSLITVSIFIMFLLSSCDIIFQINISGYNVRMCYIVALIPTLGYIFSKNKNRIIKILGSSPLIIWVVFMILFIPNSLNVKNAIGYIGWLLLNVFIIFALTHYLSKPIYYKLCNKLYIMSFFILSIVGLIQTVLAFFNIEFFTTQGKFLIFQRINGFSYEPSYYATYMLLGWVISVYLLEKKAYWLFKKTTMIIIAITLTITLFLSMSRMAWLMMGLWVVFRIVCLLFRTLQNKISFNSALLLMSLPFIMIIIYIMIKQLNIIEKINFNSFFTGLGFFGEPSHSITGRLSGMENVIKTFFISPFIGRSLGGVDPAIADFLGITYTNTMNGMGISVLLEVLLASGIFIFPIFIYYLWIILKRPMCLLKDRPVSEKSIILKAYLYSYIVEFIILQFNQNILRVYFWIHIGMLCAAYNNLKYNCEKYIVQNYIVLENIWV